ncbi:GH1 family beta-glucosidase [Pseudonocardia acaciae]|uniref:GH1 family beta-glucosidase n=1 Tax=Pseudonocardia acaciae TaxID=551276 RepID=UPI00055F60AA|nr:GH1 family beta-glucosidase [Pseudonocardia acaciae]
MTRYRFPDGFAWGAGTSAYQIEGSPLADGAGMSLQHTYAHTPGNVLDGVTGDVLADHYHRWPEDVALMRDLGLGEYQFSVAWPRVLPDGTGTVNGKGIGFYDRLVDALLAAGVAPAPILHVWDLPVALHHRGGWMNRDSAEWFAAYADVVYERLGDRVPRWMTICEPLSIAGGGYIDGLLAPRMRDLHSGLRVAHHVLLAHGRAVEAFRAGDATGEIGTSTGLSDIQPASGDPADLAAAARMNEHDNALYLDPIMRGEYPERIVARYGEAWPEVRDGDLATIAAPIDFLGVTYYQGQVVAAADDALTGVDALLGVRTVPTGRPVTGIGWDINPEGLTRALLWLKERYGDFPLVLTEFGAAFDDVVVDGAVDDRARREFLCGHLIAAHAAIRRGVDLRGAFVWSLLDTWEFWLGVTARFGIVHVDYETKRRTVKESGHWYARVMAENGFDG